MSSKARQVLDAVVARLGAIRTADGYFTDAGTRVHRNVRQVPDGETAPFLVVRPDGDDIGSRNRNRALVTLRIEVAGFVDGVAADAGGALCDLLYDIRRAMALSGDPPLGGLARRVDIDGARFEEPDEGGRLAAVVVTVGVEYVDDWEA